MEKDIKILESYTTDLFHSYNGEVIIKATKNLLKAYKEQEEKLNIKKNTPEWEYQYWEARKEVNNEWKSKIKEKIEELEKELQKYKESEMEKDDDYFFDINAIQGEIQVLQDLLKGEDEC